MRSGIDARQAGGIAWREALAPPRLAALTLNSTPPLSVELRRTQLGAIHKAWWLQPGHPGRGFRPDFRISPTGRADVDAL